MRVGDDKRGERETFFIHKQEMVMERNTETQKERLNIDKRTREVAKCRPRPMESEKHSLENGNMKKQEKGSSQICGIMIGQVMHELQTLLIDFRHTF